MKRYSEHDKLRQIFFTSAIPKTRHPISTQVFLIQESDVIVNELPFLAMSQMSFREAGCLCSETDKIVFVYKFNLSSPGQNGRRFADDIFRCIFMNKKFCILIKISLKSVPKGPTNNNPALV